MSRIAFLVCHLTGTGHLVRTLQLARAARARGHDVTVISGGRPLAHLGEAGVDIVQLPPVTVRGLEFTTLRRADGELADSDYMAGRGVVIANCLQAVRPDILVTELYPFGRRVLAKEFEGAIRAVQGRVPMRAPAIVASVRDAPEPKPRRLREVAETLSERYDLVLVHGDESFLPLIDTWPVERVLPDLPPIRHSGYVGEPMRLALADNPGVLVSVGGGVLGRRLLEVAAEAAARSSRSWLVLVGGADAAEVAGALAQGLAARAPNLRVEPARPDYRALLASADCSISLCGYNTAVELAQVATPAILVPSDEAGEREQTIRARRFAEHEGFRLMALADLTPEALAEAAESAAAGPRRPPVPLRLDDGTGAIVAIERAMAEKRAAL